MIHKIKSQTTREKRRESDRKYYFRNKEKIRIYVSKYRREHADEFRKRDRAWRKNTIKKIGKKAFYRRVYRRVVKWRKSNPLKHQAHKKVFHAIRNGTLKKKPCYCGSKRSEAHHKDYSQPLKVVWLCKPHHCLADRLLRTKLSTGRLA